MSELKHGIILPNWEVGGDTERLVEFGVVAEEAGWDGVFLADHLAMGGEDGHPDFPDPWITLSGIAARTDEIKLGSLVTPIPRRQPWQLARISPLRIGSRTVESSSEPDSAAHSTIQRMEILGIRRRSA